MEKRVWAAWIPAISDNSVGLYRTTSRSKAKYLCFLSARDVGYKVSLTEVKARRRPEFDGSTFRNGVMPEFVAARAAGGEG